MHKQWWRSLDHGLPFAPAKGGGVNYPTLAEILALSGMELAYSMRESGAAFQERTGAGATTASGADDVIGSLRNFGSLAGWNTAAGDTNRPVMRSAGGLWWAEGDGVDDLLSGSIGAFRACAQWRLFIGVKNTGTTAAVRQFVNILGLPNARAAGFFAATTGAIIGGGRRANSDSFASAAGSAHASEDIVLTIIGNYSDTDCIIRVNGVQEAINNSWLSAGNSDNDGGVVNLFSGSAGGGWAKGNLACVYGAVGAMSAENQALIERRVAYELGVTLT